MAVRSQLTAAKLFGCLLIVKVAKIVVIVTCNQNYGFSNLGDS